MLCEYEVRTERSEATEGASAVLSETCRALKYLIALRSISAQARFAMLQIPHGGKHGYSLRSPFGPHGTTCVTPLRYVPTEKRNRHIKALP